MLNADYEVLRLVSMKRAIAILLRENNPGRIELTTGGIVRSAGGFEMDEPSVVVLKEYRKIRENIRKAQIKKLRVFTRYGFRCGYCGKRFPAEKLTLDHVIPKSWGGADTPNNLAASCKPCNNKKANRTPEQAGMVLSHQPKHLTLSTNRILSYSWSQRHPEWKPYLYQSEDAAGDPRLQTTESEL